jgi:hypothetical protein
MTDKPLITHERLLEVLSYEPETGEFWWRIRIGSRCPMNRPAGTPTGFQKKYLKVAIDGRSYTLHRLAWFYMTGRWPNPECDHRDLNERNNRWSNLREATRVQNGLNRRLHKNNTSGYKGISWHKKYKKWRAYVFVDGKKVEKLFDRKEDAMQHRKNEANRFYGEFNNHQ